MRTKRQDILKKYKLLLFFIFAFFYVIKFIYRKELDGNIYADAIAVFLFTLILIFIFFEFRNDLKVDKENTLNHLKSHLKKILLKIGIYGAILIAFYFYYIKDR
ncbi:hypothetical protein [Flavobacterium sp. UMI-01]|uniref:hypothetical protein n=1 Tax=Flavobacterium sp. UMI-01 TaxID=1441053 RepID=UPI001C7D15FC|nr:hypothetical protein [Flavobacterium sp. UMI-01]GIZ09765.1 hypothetical protein FUMI01_24920 [Flavobacterium sp. UMI-01]